MLVKGPSCQLSKSSSSGCSNNNSNNRTSGKLSNQKKPKTIQIIQMLDKFHDIIGGIHVPVDDGVDKLNRKYTLLVFLFLALPIFTKQYIGDPIECFAPVYFAEHQSRYINSYCWTQSTYYMVPVGDPEDDGDQQEPPDRIMPDEVDYFIGFETVTHIGNERLRRVRVSYYQWAPLILLVQGLCFYIPFLIWNSCANNAGVKLRRLLKKASDIASLPPGCQQREALLAEFVDQFHTLVTGEAGWCADIQCGLDSSPGGSSNSSQASNASSNSQQSVPVTSGPQRQTGNRGGGGSGHPSSSGAHQDRDAHGQERSRGHHGGGGGGGGSHKSGCCLGSIPIIGGLLACCLKPCSSFGLVGPSKYLCLLYLAVKSAYVFNVGLQFFLLGQFLGRGYLKHGLELINRLIVNGDWWASPRFPLSTLCQVRADMSGGLRSYTCQCVLPINVFNEKIFSVVWFYMAFLMPLNVLSLLFWIYRTFETNRIAYIRLCLWRTRLIDPSQLNRTASRLSQSYLGWDGVFLLRLIEHNHGSIMATLITSRLWEFYANQMKLQEEQNQLTITNNAQHTLSNTTTAISNQQLLAAAAAAAAVNQIGPGPGGGSGSHGHHPGAGGGGHHSHGAPLMPVQQHPVVGGNQLVSAAGHSGPGGMHPGAGHGGHSSGHGHGGGHGNQYPGVGFASGNHGGGGPMGPMGAAQHGAHAHHSGQISQPGSHHPLHAANTHHAHHHPAPPHLSGPFANASNASLLAQLQHQQHSHQQQQQGGGHHSGQQVAAATAAAVAAAAAAAATQQQGPASGNVAAAVAALAAAAAANSTNPTSSSSQQQQQQTPGSSSLTSGSQQQPATSSSSSSGGSNQPQTSMHQNPLLSLHSLMQQQAPPSGSGANSSQQQTTTSALQQAASSGSQTSNSALQSSAQQQQQATTTTTSFITAATGGGGGGLASGPPLPPPPPAHVVAAVAAANSSAVAGNSAASTSAATAPVNLAGSAVPGMARTGVTTAGARVAAASGPQQQQQQQQQQPVPPPHTNPVLFNLKSSSIQAAANNGTRYSPHTIKRT